MKNLYRKKPLMLLSIGILTIAASQILTHYLKVSDLMQGLSFGVGIGLLITAIVFRNKTLVKAS